MSETNGGSTLILSDTTRKIVDVVKELEFEMKAMTRQDQYQARQAVNALKLLLANKVLA